MAHRTDHPRRWQWVLAAVALAIAGSSCGAPTNEAATDLTVATTAVSIAASEAMPPATEAIDCPNVVAASDYTERGESFSIDDETRLYDDAGRVQAYGTAHEDSFGGVRFAHQPYVRLVVALKEDIDEHCWALRDLLEHDDGFEVIPASYSHADLRAAGAAVEALGGGAAPPEWGPIRARLPVGEVSAAKTLHAEYGEMLEINVGGLPFPPPSPEVMAGACPTPIPTGDLPPLAISIEAGAVISAVDGGDVTVTLENAGEEPGVIIHGQQTLYLYRSGLERPAATFTGGIDAWAISREIQPGESIPTDAFVGVTPCDLDGGYVLAPGEYELRGPIEGDWNGERFVAYVDPVAVTITP